MTTTTSRATELCQAAGFAAPGTGAAYVQKRETTWGCRVLDEGAPEALGAWQSGAILLVEEERRRRERTPFGDRWPTRYQRYLVIEERAGEHAGERVAVHRHPVPRSVGSVRAGIAWCLRLRPEDLRRITRAQGDVYVLEQLEGQRRLGSDPLPTRHDVGPDGMLVHPVHGSVRAALAGEEIYRVCRRAATATHATGGSRD